MRERDRVLSEASSDTLLTSLIIIVSEWKDDEMSSEVRLIHAWTCEELERRMPEISRRVMNLIEQDPTQRYGVLVAQAAADILEL